MRNLKRFIANLFILTILFSSCIQLASGALDEGRKPKLVVFIVIDQFRYDYLRFADLFSSGGFKFMIDNGANLAEHHYGHAATITAAGHAVLLSGAYAFESGITGNEWYDRTTKQKMYSVEDSGHRLLRKEETKLHDGTSPKNFVGTTVGDELKLHNKFQSKVISISIKDVPAILLGGKTGTAYWYNSYTGDFISSDYYMKALPAWVKAFNAQKIPDQYFGKQWTKLLDEKAYARSREDNFPCQ